MISFLNSLVTPHHHVPHTLLHKGTEAPCHVDRDRDIMIT